MSKTKTKKQLEARIARLEVAVAGMAYKFKELLDALSKGEEDGR